MLGIMNSDVSQVNLTAVYVANGLGVFLLTAILYGRHKWYRINSCDGYLFRWMCRICLILCILEAAGFALNGRQFFGARQAAVLCSSLLLFLGSVLGWLWIWYVDCKLLPVNSRNWRKYLPLAIPAAAVGLMSLANLAFPVFFTVSEENIYSRTRWFFIPWVITYAYLIWGTIRIYRYQRRTDRRILIPALMFLLPIFLGSMIQMFFYGISLVWVSAAAGLVCLYINLQRELVYLDPLTGLYNRGYLFYYLDSITSQARPDRRVTGIMLDINGFKQINDTLGHHEGDTVLQDVARILMHAAGNNTVIRYGGDEFVVLVENAQPEQVQTLMENFRQGLGHYSQSRSDLPPVSFSIGTAEFDYTCVFQFLREMDMRMYDEKRSFYLGRESHTSIRTM